MDVGYISVPSVRHRCPKEKSQSLSTSILSNYPIDEPGVKGRRKPSSIHKGKRLKTFPCGLVEVNTGDLIARDVDRSRVRYRFVLGREAMQLVRIISDHKGGWLFGC
jgi:hypothetical protein